MVRTARTHGLARMIMDDYDHAEMRRVLRGDVDEFIFEDNENRTSAKPIHTNKRTHICERKT